MDSSNKSNNFGCASFSAADAAHHVRADLGDDGRSSHGSGRWQSQQEFYRFFLLGHQGGNIHLHPMDRPLQVVEMVQQFANEPSMMRLDPSIQRQTQRG